MADILKGYGRIVAGDQFEFSLDGISTADQMDKLIKISDKLLKTWDPTHTGSFGKATNKAAQEAKTLGEAFDELADDTKKASKTFKESDGKAKYALKSLLHGSLPGALEALDTNATRFALGLGTVVGALTGYADKLTEGLQQGISGNILDFAVMAKTAGVSIADFTKALSESAGGFASLGSGATNGAKQFASLVGSVREATASVGNLGMTNEQIAMFTAQQTKTAISQGFKGKQAQDVVIKNSRALGVELDELANKTGKSVMELAAAAMKLAQDPLVANFVQTAKQGGDQISKSVQKFGASLRAIFGEAGESLASDTLKSALSGLPLVITQTGKNMILASSSVYSELERQARIVKAGGDLTEQDQEKLRNTVLAEVKARGEELRTLSMLEGPMGESAKQLLALAEQANFYNSEEVKKRREEDKRAQQFNASIRQFQANMQALAIPLLELANAVDWGAFVNVLNAAVSVIKGLLWPFQKFGELLGISNAPGTIIGGLMGIIAMGGLVASAFTLISSLGGWVSKRFAKLAEDSMVLAGAFEVAARRIAQGKAPIGGMGGPINKKGAAAAGIISGIATVGMAYGSAQGASTTAGATGGVLGDVVGSGLGYLGGAMLGRVIGGVLGSAVPIVGTMLGGALGGWLGGMAGDALSSSASDLGSISGSDSGAKLAQDSNRKLGIIAEAVVASRDDSMYGNAMARQQLRAADQQTASLRSLAANLG